MTVIFGSGFTVRSYPWTVWKAMRSLKNFSMQHDDDGTVYTIWGYDAQEVHSCVIWKGSVPDGVTTGGYSQAQNDQDRNDFEANYITVTNYPIIKGLFDDPRVLRKFGNLTTTGSSEILPSVRPYSEQNSQAQRSVRSTSAQDNPSGSGAKVVRIKFLNSNYIAKSEDITLNGTTPVNTANTDIRFIEDFFVVSGSVAAGAIEIFTAVSGGGTAFCGISSATEQAFLCHHYVPSGSQCWIRSWGASCNDDTNFKLKNQLRFSSSGTLVDYNQDLVNLTGIVSGVYTEFNRTLNEVVCDEKSYVRITAVPSASVSNLITIRVFMEFFEDKK